MTTIKATDHGARGVAIPAETQVCPARVHAGWNPLAELRRDIYRAPKDDPAARDTAGLQAAIDAAAEQGGGLVVVPSGDYLTGPLWLRSKVYLQLAPGATLWGSPELEDYPAGQELDEARHGGNHLTGRARDIALINAEGLVDTGIIGPGRINGQGGAFFIPWWRADKSHELQRPWRLIRFNNCERVTVDGVRIEDSPGWTLVFRDSRHIRVTGVSINSCHGPNVDGIDLENSSFVTISDCDIFTTDDGICLKSTRPDGVVQNVVVTNCNVRTLCNAFKIGTETLGIVEDVLFSNCTAYNRPDDPVNGIAAIAVSACDGGRVERVQFRQISARQLRAAFYLYTGRRTRYQSAFREPLAGTMNDVTIAGLQTAGCVWPSFATGLPDGPIGRLTLSDIRLGIDGPIETPSGSVPELPDAYPDARMYGPLPSRGLYLRHVRECALDRVSVAAPEHPDPRPDWVAEQVTSAVPLMVRQ